MTKTFEQRGREWLEKDTGEKGNAMGGLGDALINVAYVTGQEKVLAFAKFLDQEAKAVCELVQEADRLSGTDGFKSAFLHLRSFFEAQPTPPKGRIEELDPEKLLGRNGLEVATAALIKVNEVVRALNSLYDRKS